MGRPGQASERDATSRRRARVAGPARALEGRKDSRARSRALELARIAPRASIGARERRRAVTVASIKSPRGGACALADRRSADRV